MSLNAIDVLLAVIVLLTAVNGWRHGFILGLLDLVGWALSLLCGLRFYRPIAQWLGAHLHYWPSVWNPPIGFVLCAFFAGVLFYLLSHALLRSLPERIHERRLNKVLGILPGLASGFILAAIVSSLLLAVPLNERLSDQVRDSRL